MTYLLGRGGYAVMRACEAPRRSAHSTCETFRARILHLSDHVLPRVACQDFVPYRDWVDYLGRSAGCRLGTSLYMRSRWGSEDSDADSGGCEDGSRDC